MLAQPVQCDAKGPKKIPLLTATFSEKSSKSLNENYFPKKIIFLASISWLISFTFRIIKAKLLKMLSRAKRLG